MYELHQKQEEKKLSEIGPHTPASLQKFRCISLNAWDTQIYACKECDYWRRQSSEMKNLVKEKNIRCGLSCIWHVKINSKDWFEAECR